ncbi:MAG: QcrA and Rieske domain-containing protein [Solirubrobacteraceae bacterium]
MNNLSRIIGGLLGMVVALRTSWRALRHRSRDGLRVTAATVNGRGPSAEPDPSEREVPSDRRPELIVAALLVAASVAGFAFTGVYVVYEHNTQLLGLALGCCFALLAAAAIVAGKMVVVQETSVQPRDQLLVEEDVQEVVEIVEAGGEGITRRGLLVGAGGLAAAGAATAAITPIASLGPPPHVLHGSPWTRGVRFVDTEGTPFTASEIQIGTFYTALPEGRNWEDFGAGILVIRLPVEMIHLPPARRGWTPQGIMAFSKICPHAGCAISLYRYPLNPSTSVEQPAFTCPCHYSTFDPADGGKVIFGPAGRPLPQLPVMIDSAGYLRAAGSFDEDIGPSWWGVHRV